MQKFPNLKDNQVALLRADACTGHVLDEMFKLAISDEQKVYTVLSSYYGAVRLAKAAMEAEKNVEFFVYGKNQEVLFDLSPVVSNSFNFDFCVKLQGHLCRTFGNSSDEDISQFWCDGMAMPDQKTMKSLIETKTLITTAWIGIDGQCKYQMTIKLGEQSLDRLKRGLSLIDCLPGEETFDGISVDIDSKTIEIQLK
jgi:hypothetical protein